MAAARLDNLNKIYAAVTISVRVIGGAIAYAIYYNLLRRRFINAAFTYIAPAYEKVGGLSEIEFYYIVLDISGNLRNTIGQYFDAQWKMDAVIYAGQQAFAASYPIVYYVSIAFGGVAIIASCFLPSIEPFMDGHVAVSYVE